MKKYQVKIVSKIGAKNGRSSMDGGKDYIVSHMKREANKIVWIL